jgi:hypothetical protein
MIEFHDIFVPLSLKRIEMLKTSKIFVLFQNDFIFLSKFIELTLHKIIKNEKKMKRSFKEVLKKF